MPSPCNKTVTDTGIAAQEAEELLQRVTNLAEIVSKRTGMPVDQALRSIAGELIAEEKMMAKVHHRNALLTLQKKKDLKNYVGRFVLKGRTAGEGILAFLQGSSRVIDGARASLDYQSKALHGKYFGRMVTRMDQEGVLSVFKNHDEAMMLDIYKEMGEITPGQPSTAVTKNAEAFKIAQIIEEVSAEVVARQNRAGAYITRMPGYITRQTHDQSAIRALGLIGNSPASKHASYKAWSDFVLPLINHEKTFKGADPKKVLRNVHEGLYSGVHGPARDEGNIGGVTVLGSLASKVSEARMLHFKGPEEAFKYNQALGIKNFKEQILHDLHVRTRSIAMMESLGPSPDATLKQVIREMEEKARVGDDAAKQVDSLSDWRIQSAFNEISGRNEMSNNPTLSNALSTVKVLAQVAKMGSVVLSSLSDRAFLQAEMAHQGMSHLQVFAAQLTSLIPKSAENKQMLRLMGVAMDGLMGNALSRYSSHSTTSGWAHELQKHFFNLNGLNLWTDASKGAAAQLMSAHLGEHAHLKFAELPEDLARLLPLYDITPSRWDAIRSHVVDHNGSKMVLPDAVKIPSAKPVDPAIKIGDEVITGTSHFDAIQKAEKSELDTEHAKHGWVLADGQFSGSGSHQMTGPFLSDLVSERGLTPSPANIARERDIIDTALRTYFMDRVDHAIPTPGAAERKYTTFDTKAGTPLGEAVRMVMLFKSFPITIMRKILGREIYGRGATSVGDWLMHDHKGKFNMATLIAMSMAAGYVSGAIKDALKGRTPKPLVDDDGSLIWRNINDAAIRGGSLGIMGDVLLSEYESNYRGFLSSMAGPIVGQMDTAMDVKTGLMRGEDVTQATGKLFLDNAPMINLFYIRPVLDYIVLWQLQEMMSPGSLRRMESAVQRNNKQGFFMKPSEQVK